MNMDDATNNMAIQDGKIGKVLEPRWLLHVAA